ncbi:MAG: sigma-70 family RNA polymerase sigma factor [Bryobacteraceae bacterium]|nr:sigma-70 family RNA polymerase sigma factor [Bryobacteraceae bacterium]MDW8379548.1 sigma-70 family RNA polymerase sigma factor [Bryobacterales bacterium]
MNSTNHQGNRPPSYASDPDLELVVRSKQGDASSFERLVKRHARRVYSIARHITQSEADSEEATQETFLRAYSRLNSFEGHSTFQTWVAKIAVNEALAILRRRHRLREFPLEEPVRVLSDEDLVREVAIWEENPEQLYARDQLRKILEEAIAGLPLSYRVVFLLRDIQNLSTEDTAEALNLSLPAVKSRLLRARLLLRERLSRRFRKKQERNRKV